MSDSIYGFIHRQEVTPETCTGEEHAKWKIKMLELLQKECSISNIEASRTLNHMQTLFSNHKDFLFWLSILQNDPIPFYNNMLLKG